MLIETAVEDSEKLELFLVLSHELLSNFEDLGMNRSLSISLRREGKMILAKKPAFSRHRFKGLLSDYRLFHNFDKGRSLFYQSASCLRRAGVDANEIDKVIAQWESVRIPIAGWGNNYTPSDVLESALNTRFFHYDAKPRYSDISKLELLELFDDNALIWGLFLLVKDRLGAIMQLERLVVPTLLHMKAAQALQKVSHQ